MEKYFKDDLAYVYDIGFSDVTSKISLQIIKILHSKKIKLGNILVLGCGSGILSQKLYQANFNVLGIDISESMLELASRKAPEVNFCLNSFFKITIPECNAVLSIGNSFNYLFDANNNIQNITNLLQNIYNSLTNNGVLIFDILEPGQLEHKKISKNFLEGKDWYILTEEQENKFDHILTRKITTFVSNGVFWQKDTETHLLKLYSSNNLKKILTDIGFKISIGKDYGNGIKTNSKTFICTKLK